MGPSLPPPNASPLSTLIREQRELAEKKGTVATPPLAPLATPAVASQQPAGRGRGLPPPPDVPVVPPAAGRGGLVLNPRSKRK